MTTSELSMTLYNSFQIRLDFPAAKMYSRGESLASKSSVTLLKMEKNKKYEKPEKWKMENGNKPAKMVKSEKLGGKNQKWEKYLSTSFSWE